jgi:flagellin
MASVLNTNMASITAQRYLTTAQNKLQTSYEKLSSGSRINRAQDDAAGMGISQKLVSSINSTSMAIRNANDAIGAAQTAEGAMAEISNLLQRFRELSVQGGNQALSGTQRGFLVGEMLQLRTEMLNIASRTKFNGNSLLDAASEGSLTFQTGERAVDIQNVATFQLSDATKDLGKLLRASEDGDSGFIKTYFGTNVANGDATDTYSATNGYQAAAEDFISTESGPDAAGLQAAIDTAINYIASKRAGYGSLINRLNANVNNLTALHENLSAANSRVVDTDYASETASLTKTQILQQAATAMLSQANASPNVVLALLK